MDANESTANESTYANTSAPDNSSTVEIQKQHPFMRFFRGIFFEFPLNLNLSMWLQKTARKLHNFCMILGIVLHEFTKVMVIVFIYVLCPCVIIEMATHGPNWLLVKLNKIYTFFRDCYRWIRLRLGYPGPAPLFWFIQPNIVLNPGGGDQRFHDTPPPVHRIQTGRGDN